MGENSENPEEETSTFDLEDIKRMEEAVILAAIDEDFSDISKEEAGDIIGKLTLGRLRVEIEQEIKRIDDEKATIRESGVVDRDRLEKKSRVEKIQPTSHIIVEYFTLSSIFIESFSIELLSQELIQEEYRGTKKTKRY